MLIENVFSTGAMRREILLVRSAIRYVMLSYIYYFVYFYVSV